MARDPDTELDALLLNPLLALEARLRERDHGAQHELDDRGLVLVREEHALRLDSDECEIILATDAPVAARPQA